MAAKWNPLMDDALMHNHSKRDRDSVKDKRPKYTNSTRSAERKAEQKHAQRYQGKAHTRQRPALPHERSFTEAMASDGGVELEHVMLSVGEPCDRCRESMEARTQTQEQQQYRVKALRTAVAKGDLRLADVDLRGVGSYLPSTGTDKALNASTWAWYISLLVQHQYVNPKTGRTVEAQARADAKRFAEFQGNRRSSRQEVGDDFAEYAEHGDLDASQHPMTATIDYNNPATHILGLPIPPEFREIRKRVAALEAKDAERLKRKQKVPTDFKKKPPRIGEALLLDHDGTGARTRFVIVTGMRKNDKGFVVTGNLKVSWSGKPKPEVENAFPETCRVRRDSKALMERRREASIAFVESFEWGTASGSLLDQVSLLIQNTQDARKQRMREKEAENKTDDAKPAKRTKTKNKSSKRFK